MLVVVEHLVVEPTWTVVALDEDRIGSVDGDLPDVVIAQQRREGAVRAEVAQRAIDDAHCVGDLDSANPALVVEVPAIDLVHHDRSELVGCHVNSAREPLRAVLCPPFDLLERSDAGVVRRARHTASASASNQRPRLPGVIGIGSPTVAGAPPTACLAVSTASTARATGSVITEGSGRPPRTASSTALRSGTKTGLASLPALAATSVGNPDTAA